MFIFTHYFNIFNSLLKFILLSQFDNFLEGTEIFIMPRIRFSYFLDVSHLRCQKALYLLKLFLLGIFKKQTCLNVKVLHFSCHSEENLFQ